MTGSTHEPGEPAQGPAYETGSNWFRWTAPANGSARAEVCGITNNVETSVGVYTNPGTTPSLATLNTVGVGSQNSECHYAGESSVTSSVSFTAVAGITYYISYEGIHGDSGYLSADLNFEPVTYNVSVSITGTGSGAVYDGYPRLIRCDPAEPEFSTCTGDYDENTTLELSARPTYGSIFTGWSGACSGVGTCLLPIDAAKSVTVNFDPIPPPPIFHRLTTTIAGSGSGKVAYESAATMPDCLLGSCVAELLEGTAVTLKPVATAGSSFAGWSDDCVGLGACTISLTKDTTATAVFTADVIVTLGETIRSAPAEASPSTAGNPAASAGTEAVASPPANLTLKLGKPAVNRRRGTATVAARVSGAARIDLTGKDVKTNSSSTKRAGTVMLPVVANRKLLRALKQKGHASVKVTVKATTAAGTTVSRSITVKLHKAPQHQSPTEQRKKSGRRGSNPPARITSSNPGSPPST